MNTKNNIQLTTKLVFCALLSLEFLSNSAFAVNKCTAQDGSISFQDAPCSNSAKAKEAIQIRRNENTLSNGSAYGINSLDQTGTARQNATRAAAALEALLGISRDCKIKLEVYGPTTESLNLCQNFLSHHKAWWKPSLDAIEKLTKNTELARDETVTIERATDHMSKINANAQFILLRMKTFRSQ